MCPLGYLPEDTSEAHLPMPCAWLWATSRTWKAGA